MSLWLARHARPLVAPGCCYGQWDVPADAADTARAAQDLAQVLPHGVPVYASPLQRCEQLALALQGLRPDLAYRTDARLQELNFGAWEGQPWDAIARHELDAWAADFAHYRPGGGESLVQMLARVAQALDERQARPALWISHAGVARCVQWLCQQPAGQLPTAAQWTAPAPAFGAWMVFDARLPGAALPAGGGGHIG